MEDEISDNNLSPFSISDSLIQQSKDFESSEGLRNICEFVDSHLKQGESLGFIDEYRKIIRTNKWHYQDNIDTNYLDFLKRWDKTHNKYISSAISFYEHLKGEGSQSFSEIHKRAIISETFRGREGKRSKIGLDNLLDFNIGKLNHMLRLGFNAEEAEDMTGLFASSMNSPFISAEHELFCDLYSLSRRSSYPFSLDKIDSLNQETNGLLSKVLREYSKYSLADLNKKLALLNPQEETMKRKEEYKISLENERLSSKDKAHSSLIKLGGIVAEEFINTLETINNLNYINSNLEVKYSFKGWPGLFHHWIFQNGKEVSSLEDIHERQYEIEFIEENKNGN